MLLCPLMGCASELTLDTLVSVRSCGTDRYSVAIDFGKASLTGILVVKDENDVLKGGIVNEFGVSMVDFSYSKEKDKVRIHRLGTAIMKRYYVRCILRKDLRQCMHILYGMHSKLKRAYTVEHSGDEVRITNTRRGITYTFATLKTAGANGSER